MERRFSRPWFVASSLCALLHLCPLQAARAELLISPANVVFDLAAERRPSGVIEVTNTGDDTVRYRVKAVRFGLSETGGIAVGPADPTSLADWVRFNPKELEIPAKAKQVIRYTLQVPKQLPTGEYWGAIELEPLNAEMTSVQDGSGRSYELKVISSALVILVGRNGPIQYSVASEGATVQRGAAGQPGQLVLKIRNTGRGKVDVVAAYHLTEAGGKSIATGEIQEATLLSDSSRVVTALLDPPPAAGTYVLDLTLSARQLSSPVRSRHELTVLP